uniref:Uncharacterized protein n=1 Tax=Arundo donax TaxID=35708 RepID=A0A0A9EH01_ARUDO
MWNLLFLEQAQERKYPLIQHLLLLPRLAEDWSLLLILRKKVLMQQLLLFPGQL